MSSPNYCSCCGKRYDGARMCPDCKESRKKHRVKPSDLAAICACCQGGCQPNCPNCWGHKPGDPSTIRGAKSSVSDVSVDFVVEDGGGGYQMDLYIDGKLQFIGCRDFGGDGGKQKIVESLVEEITKAVNRWREKN